MNKWMDGWMAINFEWSQKDRSEWEEGETSQATFCSPSAQHKTCSFNRSVLDMQPNTSICDLNQSWLKILKSLIELLTSKLRCIFKLTLTLQRVLSANVPQMSMMLMHYFLVHCNLKSVTKRRDSHRTILSPLHSTEARLELSGAAIGKRKGEGKPRGLSREFLRC